MQLMTWPLARMGSRFGLLFEPAQRRVLHSGLGRFVDEPLDFAVGLVEPDGTERVFPFTTHGEPLYACEQFERVNSITYRGYSEHHGLRMELNLHSPFYPQNEKICLSPVFYIELRITWAKQVRLRWPKNPPKTVKLFLRLNRPNTEISVSKGQIDLSYEVKMDPRYDASCGNDGRVSSTDNIPPLENPPRVRVQERIQSLNRDAEPMTTEDGSTGLSLELPVTDEGSGMKWRLAWGTHTSDPVLDFGEAKAVFRYVKHWPDLESVLADALENRDDRLALSRRFEKIIEQTPLIRACGHLINLGFQSFLSNTFWCDVDDGREWFSVLEGTSMFHSSVDVEYNISMVYFALWPKLLAKLFDAWSGHTTVHDDSDGRILHHDMGHGFKVTGQAYGHLMPVENNANFLLLLQAYAHWTADLKPLENHADLVRDLARYLLWTDRDDSGFPSEGAANTLDDGSGPVQFAAKQAYLAIKRSTALDAAADLLDRVGQAELAETCRSTSERAVPKIEEAAWLGDHYVVSIDQAAHGLFDTYSGKEMPTEEMVGWDDYSIYTSNGLLLPAMIAQPVTFDRDRLQTDMHRAMRETLQPYGCSHTSSDQTNIWISSNVWRDFAGRYLHVELLDLAPRYWDMLVYSNTRDQSFGYVDTYIGNELAFYPRGVAAIGYLLAGPRLRIDRLDTHYISIDPDRHRPQRWPLLPLADWDAGKIPICVVDAKGNVRIESEIEPIKILDGPDEVEKGTIG
jgi:hypothetical protein